jgi:F-type H+-transporting ATPase subunit b
VNINLTLLGQMISFALLVWFTMKFVWPPLTKAMAERQSRIADGLAAGERGRHELEVAQKKATAILRDAHANADGVIAQATHRAVEIVDQAKGDARADGERLIAAARTEIEIEMNRARESLRAEVARLAVAGAAKLLEQELDRATHARLVDSLTRKL